MGRLFRQVQLLWFVLLSITIACLFVAPLSGFAKEDIQTILFPFVLVSLWRLPREPKFRVPSKLIAVVFVLWVGATLHLRRSFPGRNQGIVSYISRLDQDPQGLAARTYYRRYMEISKTYHLPAIGLLYRNFANSVEASQWLSENSSQGVMIRGSALWPTVVFPRLSKPFHARLRQSDVLPDWYVVEAKKLDLALAQDALIVRLPGTDVPIAVAIFPEEFAMPLEPADLSAHLLAWAAAGLWPEQSKDIGSRPNKGMRLRRVNLQRDRLNEACRVEGPWKTNAPLGAAQFFLGTLDLLDYIANGAREQALSSCAVQELVSGAAFAVKWTDPQVFASLFNNAVVVKVVQGLSGKEDREMRKWLFRAATTVDDQGQPVRSAKLAMLNLIALERGGIL